MESRITTGLQSRITLIVTLNFDRADQFVSHRVKYRSIRLFSRPTLPWQL